MENIMKRPVQYTSCVLMYKQQVLCRQTYRQTWQS